MARSPITTLMDDFHNLSAEEQKLFLDLVDPQPEPKAAKGGSRRKKPQTTQPSTRRRGLSEQVKGTAGGCVFMNNGDRCAQPANSPIHDPMQGYGGYHEFVPAKAAAAGGD